MRSRLAKAHYVCVCMKGKKIKKATTKKQSKTVHITCIIIVWSLFWRIRNETLKMKRSALAKENGTYAYFNLKKKERKKMNK